MGLLPIIDVIGKIIDNVIPDPDKKLDMQIQLAKLADAEAQRESNERLAQISVNRAEATNSNVFVAGWRPMCGWIGAAGLGYSFLILPFMEFCARLYGYTGQFPELNIIDLMILMSGMLGFSYHRSGDKRVGVEDSVITLPNPKVVTAGPKKKFGKKVIDAIWPF